MKDQDGRRILVWRDERQRQYAYRVRALIRRRGVPVTRAELLGNEGFGRRITPSRRWGAVMELVKDGQLVLDVDERGRTVVRLP